MRPQHLHARSRLISIERNRSRQKTACIIADTVPPGTLLLKLSCGRQIHRGGRGREDPGVSPGHPHTDAVSMRQPRPRLLIREMGASEVLHLFVTSDLLFTTVVFLCVACMCFLCCPWCGCFVCPQPLWKCASWSIVNITYSNACLI